MLVYRMEHKTSNCGPFVGNLSPKFTEEWSRALDSFSHPNPYFDGLCREFQCGIDFCGVRSLDDILSWFGHGECLTYLKDDGFVVRVYDVDDEDVKIGNTQVAFHRCDDTPIVEEIEL